MYKFLLLIVIFVAVRVQAQTPLIKRVSPSKTQNTTTKPQQFITGTVCNGCSLTINKEPVHVWPTGAFAIEIQLNKGDNSFDLTVINAKGIRETQQIFYTLLPEISAKETTKPTIEYWSIFPQGDLMLQVGDRIQMTVKTLPGCTVQLENGFELQEIPVSDSIGVKGVYKAEYTVGEKDNLLTASPLPLKLCITTPDDQLIEAQTRFRYSKMPHQPILLQTTGKMPYLLIGLGEDRLGGAKIGYLDSLIRLKAIGKTGDKYCVQLSEKRKAYIEEKHVQPVLNAPFTPGSITGNMRVWGDSSFDYTSLVLTTRLPYQSFQEINPSKIIIEVFGASGNTNWITQLQTAQEIESVQWKQTETDVFRIEISLKHKQHWGYTVYYQGNTLMIRVKRPPLSNTLQQLTIGIDAGHGGSNKGAFGLTGVMEKEMTLLLAKELEEVLLADGIKVIMSRRNDTTFDNHDRYLFFKEKNPDLLISLHLNSSADPINIRGTGTYYKHIGFKSLAQAVLKEITTIGLPENGLVGNFNFLLNGHTEFPNVLIETLYLSHPEEEYLILQPDFRKKMVLQIKKGLEKWLEACD